MLDYIFNGPMVHDDDDRFLDLLERSAHELTRQGPAPDDIEATAPFIGMMPEESTGEEPSPLDFGRGYWADKIDAQIHDAMVRGYWDVDLFRRDFPTVTYREPDPNVLPYPFDADGQLD